MVVSQPVTPLRRLPFVLGAATLILLYHFAVTRYINDDGFIHARIARNLVEHGQGFYTLGIQANASSSPLYTLLIALLFWIFGSQIIVMQCWNAVATTALGCFVWRTASGSALWRATLATLTILVVLPSSADLMEIPTALSLFVLGLQGVEKTPKRALFLFCLATLTRPEFVIAIFAHSLWSLSRRTISAGMLVSICVAVAAPALSWLYLHYGSLVPHSVQAKAVIYSISTVTFWRSVSEAMFGSPQRMWMGLGASLLLASFCAVYFRKLLHGPTFVALITLLLVVVGYRSRLVLFFPWYAPLVVVPLYLVLARLLSEARYAATAYITFLIATLPVVIPFASELRDLLQERSDSLAMKQGARVLSYRLLGNALQGEFASASVLLSEIGGFGWEFHGTVLDGAGLATPAALRFHPMAVPEERSSGSIGGVPFDFIEESKPDFLIAYPQFIKRFVGSHQAKDSYCKYELQVYPRSERSRMKSSALWGNRLLLLYAKRSTVLTEGDPECPALERLLPGAIVAELQ